MTAVAASGFYLRIVVTVNCTMMHGLTNITFIDVKQAGEIYSYKNVKRKLHKTIAAIWFNP